MGTATATVQVELPTGNPLTRIWTTGTYGADHRPRNRDTQHRMSRCIFLSETNNCFLCVCACMKGFGPCHRGNQESRTVEIRAFFTVSFRPALPLGLFLPKDPTMGRVSKRVVCRAVCGTRAVSRQADRMMDKWHFYRHFVELGANESPRGRSSLW